MIKMREDSFLDLVTGIGALYEACTALGDASVWLSDPVIAEVKEEIDAMITGYEEQRDNCMEAYRLAEEAELNAGYVAAVMSNG
ncbi:MAG: hypothetical protein FWG40_00870 [Peptococcaceae bacterium]|nr:hypothetical protein [Peptococcaceae bacterium]